MLVIGQRRLNKVYNRKEKNIFRSEIKALKKKEKDDKKRKEKEQIDKRIRREGRKTGPLSKKGKLSLKLGCCCTYIYITVYIFLGKLCCRVCQVFKGYFQCVSRSGYCAYEALGHHLFSPKNIFQMKPSPTNPQFNTVAINKAMNFAKTSEAIQTAKISLDNLEQAQKRKASSDEVRGHFEAALATARIVAIPPLDSSTEQCWLPQKQWGGWFDSYVQPLDQYFKFLQLKNKASTRREPTLHKLVRNHFEAPEILRPVPPTFCFGVGFSHSPGTSTDTILASLTCATKGCAYFFGKTFSHESVSFLSFLKKCTGPPPHIIIKDDNHFDHIIMDPNKWPSLKLAIMAKK